MDQSTFNPVVDGVVLIGDAANNLFNGTSLNDQLSGLSGKDTLRGLAGMDLLEGGLGVDSLLGGSGADKLLGEQGNDRLFGGLGDDLLHGGTGRDQLFGGANDDTLHGDIGPDLLSGGSGNDVFVGGNNQDLTNNLDTLKGGAGNDTIDGNLGHDLIYLGAGADVVVLRPTSGNDLVMDFKDSVDKIQLEGGLTFDDLKIVARGSGNSILIVDKPGDSNDGARLARFKGIVPALFDETDFIVVMPDNTAPEITSDGGGDTVAIDVAENTTAVTNVETSDDNDSEGSGLTYSLSGGADQALFSINADTGVVTFDAAPDFEAPGDANGDNDYEVQVTVTDSSGLALHN